MQLGKATRDAFGEALRDLGARWTNVVVLDGDVSNSTRTEYFAAAFPERFVQVGIAESNLVGVASGLAAAGKLPVLASFACFVMGNAFEQLRMSVAFPNLNVKVVGSHSGISIGEDGPSQMAVEDIALACALPGFAVLVPADETETRAATEAALAHPGPVYLRVGRPRAPIVYENGCPFEVGKAITLRQGSDLTIIANGLMVAQALEAADELARRGMEVRVLDMATVKPLDERAVLTAAEETGALLVAEEHLQHGGLGSIVSMVTARNHPVPMAFVNLGDGYAESGKPEELLAKYHLGTQDLVNSATVLLKRKGAER